MGVSTDPFFGQQWVCDAVFVESTAVLVGVQDTPIALELEIPEYL